LPHTVWTGLGAVLVLYCALVLWLLVAGRRSDARAWAGLIPDCIVLVRRLMADPRVPRTRRLLIGALLAYLAMPIDVIPDFVPVAGQVDDAILVAVVLRSLVCAAGEAPVREQWPGPLRTLNLILRLAGRPRPVLDSPQ
jgi:uncharacterized membrane protein YkvA (DUF1232 family)